MIDRALPSLDEIDGDISLIQDASLLQLEREWVETAEKLKQEGLHANTKVNNFTIC